jgi:hypothetical protein
MAVFTPYTQLLMDLLSELAEPNEQIVIHKEIRLLPLLPGALKVINDDWDAPPCPEYIRAKLKRERSFLERVSFVGSTEMILFDVVYGTEIKSLHAFLSSPRMSGLQLNLKTILDEHLYSRGEFRKELTEELNRASDYLYSSRAKNELEIRVLTDPHRNREDWLESYPERLALWQSSVDELFLYWELDS